MQDKYMTVRQPNSYDSYIGKHRIMELVRIVFVR